MKYMFYLPWFREESDNNNMRALLFVTCRHAGALVLSFGMVLTELSSCSFFAVCHVQTCRCTGAKFWDGFDWAVLMFFLCLSLKFLDHSFSLLLYNLLLKVGLGENLFFPSLILQMFEHVGFDPLKLSTGLIKVNKLHQKAHVYMYAPTHQICKTKTKMCFKCKLYMHVHTHLFMHTYKTHASTTLVTDIVHTHSLVTSILVDGNCTALRSWPLGLLASCFPWCEHCCCCWLLLYSTILCSQANPLHSVVIPHVE